MSVNVEVSLQDIGVVGMKDFSCQMGQVLNQAVPNPTTASRSRSRLSFSYHIHRGALFVNYCINLAFLVPVCGCVGHTPQVKELFMGPRPLEMEEVEFVLRCASPCIL
jgi:hypothetical protein